MEAQGSSPPRAFLHEEANLFRRAMRRVPGFGVAIWVFTRGLHVLDRLVFRATRGRHTFASVMTGLPIVMLTTTGAKTGARRTVPVIGLPDGNTVVVIASNWGKATHPAWYHNVRASPVAEVAWRGRVWPVSARDADAEERERLWNVALRMYPTWTTYARRAGARSIPIVVLTPRVVD